MKNKNPIFIPVIISLALLCCCLTGAFVTDTATSTPAPLLSLDQTATSVKGSACDYDGALTPAANITILCNEEIARTPDNQLTPTEYYTRNYTWSYKGIRWTETLSIPASLYDYYKAQPHDRQSDYSQYALSDYDRQSIKAIAGHINNTGAKNGYSAYDNAMNAVCFVQSLPYTSDRVTTGYDEYPRYPVETLVDNGGDCEDTAVLTAALLNEMGFDIVLIHLPGHMAVGVKCPDDYPGTYYEYNGARYYYLETTGENYRVGQMPDKYKNATAELLPTVPIPRMDVTFSTTLTSYDIFYAYYRIHCDIKNLGPGTALNASVHIAPLALSRGEGEVWVPATTIHLGDYAEGATGWAEATVRIPRRENTQVECTVRGDNFKTVTARSGTFYT